MPNAPHTFDVTEADFQERVLLRSQEVPVLVDFWATWCGPCKQLGPTLEKLAAEYDGAFELAKVDVDKCQRLAAMLRIQSIPTVYLFVGGQPVDGFQGGQPEKAIRQLLERHVQAKQESPLEVARKALAEGALALAAQAFEAVLESEPTNGEALVGLARITLMSGDLPRAEALLAQVQEQDPQATQARRLKEVFKFAAHAGEESALRATLAADPKAVAAWYSLGATLALYGRMDEALAAFIEVVALDRTYLEDGGRKAAISLFDLLGAEDPMVVKARRRLASLLF